MKNNKNKSVSLVEHFFHLRGGSGEQPDATVADYLGW